MLLDVFDSVIGSIGEVGKVLGLSWIAVIVFALLLVTLIISFFCTVFSLELKTTRAVDKINAYLESNPFITDDNLVEFNKLMKKIPAPMRAQWQQYMVNRDKKPSEFFSEEKCIDKPFKASGYNNHIIAVRSIIICLAIISFVFSCGALANVAGLSLASVIIQSLLLPLAVALLGTIYLLFLKARRNGAISDLYTIFMNFQHAIDRAVTTLPDYVDYEILFTRKEIVSGIPVLQEYLQQRALFEQEQIRKAKESQVEHQDYDFSALGINGSLVMERSMRECEYFLGNRKRILAEISELEGSRDLLEKSYDEKNKTNQRKLRDIQESLDRLKEKLDSTTNIIVGNDLRKQRENEIQKQRQLEKEVDEDNNKYEADKKKIEQEISAKKAEIEEFRKSAETSLNGEFRTYADKIYVDIKAIVDGQVKEELDSLRDSNTEMQLAVEERDRALTEKTVMYDEKLALCEQYENIIAEQEQAIVDTEAFRNEYNEAVGARDSQIQSKDEEIFAIKRELESRNLEIERKNEEIENLKQSIKDIKRKKGISEIYRYFDANGNEFYFDEESKPYYLDENNNRLYADQIEAYNQEQAQNEQYQEQPVEGFDENQLNTEEVPAEVPAENKEEVQEQSGAEEPAPELSEQLTEDAEAEILESDFDGFDEDLDELISENVYGESSNLDDNLSEETKRQLEELNREAEEQRKAEEKAKEKERKEKEKKKKKRKKQIHVPFQWENSNAPYEAETPAENKVEEAPVNQEQSIEDIEKEIQSQNEELEKQHKNLSNQLAETKAMAQDEPVQEVEQQPVVEEQQNEQAVKDVESAEQPEQENVQEQPQEVQESEIQSEQPEVQKAEQSAEQIVESEQAQGPVEETQNQPAEEPVQVVAEEKVEEKPEVKKPAKKSTKKPAKKAEQNKSKKAVAKKPASKTTAKKQTAKPAENKKSASKPASAKKVSSSKPAGKKATPKTAKKATQPKAKTEPKNKSDNSSVTVGDLSLQQFNEQLKSVFKEINSDGDKK